ncbi:autophagy protein 12 [Delitschia confertaspora ATCC 74209]|uniref:Ubiquitin-like protein ATG12 n=1 Tax=Delitschia confertaspora ATCC 74209 TaxID=1513339 RepID=A0A9P4MV01_9PLEO|nr:autophagy protein 12 [Delitschia confertaspora ATCC 74209]
MAASVVLTHLPKDASSALEGAGRLDREKVQIRLQPIGSAPHLTQKIFKISSTSPFSAVLRFLRKKLGVREQESVFCYVNNVFAPALDEGVGELWRCFRVGEELVVGYSLGAAFG